MFHQVGVPAEDMDLLKFLWWPKGDLSLMEFRIKVHLFGATLSPSSANFAMRKCAEDISGILSSGMINKVLDCFYFDDCLMATVSEDETLKIIMSWCSFPTG